jgi:peptidoglycan hydrolase-like protein with peptidoglycan-binding domain
VKVREIADSVLHKLVPAVIDVADKLSPPPVTETTPTRELQQKLHKLGYYRGAVDGKPGAQTVNALRQFQFEHHLPVTGYLDARTILLLKNIST